jgi:hypothetical protein
MNMYANANFSSLGGAGWWWGGHLNLYDNASFLANGYVNMGDVSNPNWSQSDGTRSLVIGGGTLRLPEGYDSSALGASPNWITRGMLRAYGKGEDTNDLVITDDGTNTIVTVTPLGGALQRVYFQPLLKATVPLGTFQQLVLVGDYPKVTAVYLSSMEPGLNPASFPTPVYTSSDTNVITVDGHQLGYYQCHRQSAQPDSPLQLYGHLGDQRAGLRQRQSSQRGYACRRSHLRRRSGHAGRFNGFCAVAGWDPWRSGRSDHRDLGQLWVSCCGQRQPLLLWLFRPKRRCQ